MSASPNESRDGLGPRALERIAEGSGYIVKARWVPSTDSTQRLAKELAGVSSVAVGRADDGDVEAVGGPAPGKAYLVVADEQTAGAGRRGNVWHSPKGAGLWFSLVLSSARPRAEWPVLTSLVALAARDGVNRWAPGEAGLKWPNDLYGRGRKLAGVLAEALAGTGAATESGAATGTGAATGSGAATGTGAATGSGAATESGAATGTGAGGLIVLGLGINVAQSRDDFPPDLRGRAISVAELAGRSVDRTELLAAILASLADRWAAFERGGPGTLRPALREASLLMGRRVVIGPTGEAAPADRRQVRAGRVVDLGPVGELRIRDDDGAAHTIASGYVLRVDPPLEEG